MKFKLKKYFKVVNLLLVAVFLLLSGFGCKMSEADKAKALKPITLNYWRVWDDEDAFEEILADYKLVHPNITIKYRKFKYEEFEQELINALAEDRGPDIFSIPQTWLLEYKPKLAPMPEEIKMAYIFEKTYFKIKKEQVVEFRTQKTPALREFKERYLDTVFKDVVISNQVFGLPLSLETLVMFYNKDIINQAGITKIPTDWRTFQEAVIKATKFETEDKIIQSGTALGTGFNVERSFDIISILMMQNGASMSDLRGQPTFFSGLRQSSQSSNPGLIALQFYSDFASPLKSVYSWNNTMANSLEAFWASKIGFFFGYNYHIPQIRSRSRINFGVAPIPQIPNNPTKNYANYWLEVVSNKSKYQNEAWDFILFMNKPEEVKKFLDKVQRPTAQRGLIDEQLDNEDLNAAVSQLLTAETWYKGRDILAAEQAFKEMAERFLLAADPQQINNILSTVTQKVSQTIQNPD